MHELLPNVTEEMLFPDFWTTPRLSQWDASGLREQVQRRVFSHSRSLLELSTSKLAQTLPEEPWWEKDLKTMEFARGNLVLYDDSGARLTSEFWEEVAIQVQSARAHSQQQPQIRPGFSVCRANVRRWPTTLAAFCTPDDREFNRFQDTALHTFEPVLILSQTKDSQWYYIRSTTYGGWVLQSEIAACSWEELHDWTTQEDVLVCTANTVFTQAAPHCPQAGRKWLEFAAVLPVCREQGRPLGNQSPVGNLSIHVPSRNDAGRLDVHQAFVSTREGIHRGYLPYHRSSVVSSAFALLTERYGWGDSFGSHDCSSFVMDVYRTVGLQLPRDAGEQEAALQPNRIDIKETFTYNERCELLKSFAAGDLLYMPGHVMIYLGEHANRHYVIHDFAGYTLKTAGGDQHIPVNQVMVSTLDLQTQSGKSYLESLTSAASLFRV